MIPAPSVHTNDGATPRGADIAEQLYLASWSQSSSFINNSEGPTHL